MYPILAVTAVLLVIEQFGESLPVGNELDLDDGVTQIYLDDGVTPLFLDGGS